MRTAGRSNISSLFINEPLAANPHQPDTVLNCPAPVRSKGRQAEKRSAIDTPVSVFAAGYFARWSPCKQTINYENVDCRARRAMRRYEAVAPCSKADPRPGKTPEPKATKRTRPSCCYNNHAKTTECAQKISTTITQEAAAYRLKTRNRQPTNAAEISGLSRPLRPLQTLQALLHSHHPPDRWHHRLY